MIDERRIEEATRDYINKNGYFIKYDEDPCVDIEFAYKAGAHWAINEFQKNLWHPAGEKPKEFNHYGFAALYVLQYNHQIRMVLYDKDNMNWKNVISNREYWLYVDDLLPKKGGEQ